MAASTTSSMKNDPIRKLDNCPYTRLHSVYFFVAETDKMKFHTQMVNGKPQIFFDAIGS